MSENNYRLDYVEFPANDIKATKKFYSTVFEWKFEDYGQEYTSFHDGRMSGGFAKGPPVVVGGPLPVIYADDCNIYVRSERAGRRVMASITGFITRRLKLKVNAAKSAVAQPGERKFLGFSIGGKASKRRIAPKALLRFKRKVRELTGRSRGISMEAMTKELASYLRGWKSYFGFCETPSVLQGLDQWTRRRLRSVIWKQRKRRSSWRLANSPVLSTTFPVAYFDSLGLPRLFVVG